MLSSLLLPALRKRFPGRGLVEGTALRGYRFDRYKRPEAAEGLQRLILSAHHDVSETVRIADVIVRAQNRARELGNTPANDLPPAALAEYAKESVT